jgi:hypothetical protein
MTARSPRAAATRLAALLAAGHPRLRRSFLPGQSRTPPATARRDQPASCFALALIATLRGFGWATTGIRSVSTPAS